MMASVEERVSNGSAPVKRSSACRIDHKSQSQKVFSLDKKSQSLQAKQEEWNEVARVKHLGLEAFQDSEGDAEA